MKERQKVWVVSEQVGFHKTYTNIIGVYSNEKMAKEVSYRSVNYSIEEVELNK